MPSARQGDIHDYDFGPVIGAERSGRRPAMIVSNDGFNERFGTAIALPMSSANAGRVVSLPTACVHSRCRFMGIVQAGESGAPTPVGRRHGRASIDELDDIIESLARRFTATHRPGQVATADGIMQIDAGTLWRLPVIEPGGGTFFTTVLDYNAGNNLAVTIEIEERELRPDSPGDVPVNMLD